MNTTRTIAGHTFSLVPGRRYLATREMMSRRDQTFFVSIQDITLGIHDAAEVAVVGPLPYEDANEMLNAFNDPEVSYSGRLWE